MDPAIRQRRLIALAFGVLLFILFAILVRSCVNSAAQNAVKDYNREVSTLIAQSDRDVSRPLFEALVGQTDSPVELETTINQLSSVAGRQLDEAKALDVPDELKTAQHNLLLALDLRESGVRKIASRVRTALADSDEAEAAQTAIAADMQQFLSSDVVYSQRVLPYIDQAVRDREVPNQSLQQSQFLPNLGWLDPGTVGDRLGNGGSGGGSSDGGADEDVAPGLHGHGLVSTAIGDVTLQPGEVVNRVPAGSGLAVNVTVANQGENPEEDVKVSVRISGSGKPISASRTIASTQPGAEASVAIPISTPPLGTAVQMAVTVAKVGGEEKTDNNKQTYTVFFQR